MRQDAQIKQDNLCALILADINGDPQSIDGQLWAGAYSHDEWAQRAGLTVRTFRRLIAKPPFVSTVRGSGSNKRTYLRLGAAPAYDLRKVQNTMSKIWRERTGCTWTDPRTQYGPICGMAEEWPDGWQVKVFEHALTHWGTFMACTKLEIQAALDVIDAAEARGEEPDLFSPDAMLDHVLETARRVPRRQLQIRHLEFPSLGYLRRFCHVALTVYVDHLQDRGKPVPAELSGNIYLPPVSPVEIPY